MLVLPPQRGDLGDVPFRQARNYTKASRKPGDVLWIVVHTAETAEVEHAAENLAAWAAGPNAPRASWHWAVDNSTITQSVLEKDIAWHTPGANRAGIGVLHAARGGQNAGDWKDWFSQMMLIRSAELVASMCKRWNLPVQRVGPGHLLDKTPGICGHADVSEAFGKSSHFDPGPHFPYEWYLDEVLRLSRERAPTMPPPTPKRN